MAVFAREKAALKESMCRQVDDAFDRLMKILRSEAESYDDQNDYVDHGKLVWFKLILSNLLTSPNPDSQDSVSFNHQPMTIITPSNKRSRKSDNVVPIGASMLRANGDNHHHQAGTIELNTRQRFSSDRVNPYSLPSTSTNSWTQDPKQNTNRSLRTSKGSNRASTTSTKLPVPKVTLTVKQEIPDENHQINHHHQYGEDVPDDGALGEDFDRIFQEGDDGDCDEDCNCQDCLEPDEFKHDFVDVQLEEGEFESQLIEPQVSYKRPRTNN